MAKPKMLYYIIYYLYLFITIKSEGIADITKATLAQIKSLNSRENLSQLLNEGKIFNCDNNYCSHISLIKSQLIENQELKFPQIYLSNQNNKYSKNFNNIVVVTIFTKHKFAENSINYIKGINAIIDIVYFNLFTFDGNTINTAPTSLKSLGLNNIIAYLPLYINDSLKNKILAISGQNPSNDLKNLKNYDILNPEAKIYNDICYTITYSISPENVYNKESIKNLDITLEQRKKYYFPGNLYLCPVGCEYIAIDKITMSSICQCSIEYLEIVEHNEYINFEIFNEKRFYEKNKDNYFSLDTLSCLKLSFTSEGTSNNYGLIIIIIIAVIIFLCFGIIKIFGKKYLKNQLELIYLNNPKNFDNEINVYNKNKKKYNVIYISRWEKFTPSKNNNNNHKNNNIVFQEPGQPNNIKETKNNQDNNYIININNENDERNIGSEVRIKYNKSGFDDDSEISKNSYSLFTEQEKNAMNYEMSVIYDKRNFFHIYISFLKMKQPLFFLFNNCEICNKRKFLSSINIKLSTIKIIFICYEIMIYMFIYSCFFGSESVSKIYFGTFNFGKKFALGIILSPFCMIIKSFIYYFIYDYFYKNIIEAKNKSNKKNLQIKEKDDTINSEYYKSFINELLKIIGNKTKFFAVITFIVLVLEWMIVSSFCAVYKNSQIEYIKSILVCYLFVNLFSFIYCLIPSYLRYYALKKKSIILFRIAEIAKII